MHVRFNSCITKIGTPQPPSAPGVPCVAIARTKNRFQFHRHPPGRNRRRKILQGWSRGRPMSGRQFGTWKLRSPPLLALLFRGVGTPTSSTCIDELRGGSRSSVVLALIFTKRGHDDDIKWKNRNTALMYTHTMASRCCDCKGVQKTARMDIWVVCKHASVRGNTCTGGVGLMMIDSYQSMHALTT